MPSPPQTPADSSLLGGCKDVGSAPRTSSMRFRLSLASSSAAMSVMLSCSLKISSFAIAAGPSSAHRTSARVSHTEADGGGHVKNMVEITASHLP